jgi:hypothetical protein
MALQLDPNVVLDATFDVPGKASVDAFVPLDRTVDFVDALKVVAVVQFPGGAGQHLGGEAGEPRVEVDEFAVVAGDLGFEASDSLLEFAACGSVSSAADQTEIL